MKGGGKKWGVQEKKSFESLGKGGEKKVWGERNETGWRRKGRESGQRGKGRERLTPRGGGVEEGKDWVC